MEARIQQLTAGLQGVAMAGVGQAAQGCAAWGRARM